MISGKRIGVIIATYNGENFIGEQLESILNQTVVPDEIVISDAGSTDNTVSVCKSLLKRYSSVSAKFILHDQIVPVERNFQYALEESEADYIFFCDQDDVWEKTKIEIVINKMIQENAIMAFTDAYVVDEALRVNTSLWKVLNYRSDGNVYLQNDSSFVNILIRHNIVAGMCMCIDASLKEKVIPFSKNSLHDAWITFVSILNGNVISVGEKLALYRQHNNNQVGAKQHISKSLRQSNIDHRIDFILKRKNLFGDVLNCICNCNKKNRKMLEEAVAFYDDRIKYIQGHKKFKTIYRERKLYKKYTDNAHMTMYKDILCRVANTKQ